MAQVLINFRVDDTIKKNMEQACKEMGLSMTTAFTIFAIKVGKERRIPFEVAAEPQSAQPRQHGPGEPRQSQEGSARERSEELCGEIRRSLTAIHTAVPSSITGLAMERIRLLCGDELKDKAAGVSNAVRTLFSQRSADTLREKDWSILEEYLDGLSSIAGEIREIEHTLVPAMRSWSGGDTGLFDGYERRLTGVSQEFDALQSVMGRFLCSTARRYSGARSVQARIRQAAGSVETPYVLTALENLETLILRQYDALDDQTKAHLESYYLQTLELTLRELGQAEQEGGDAGGKAALCLRAVNVVSQVIFDSGQAQRELSQRSLEAEVAALERLAALRGEIAGPIKLEP